jgi:hypothetical protein
MVGTFAGPTEVVDPSVPRTRSGTLDAVSLERFFSLDGAAESLAETCGWEAAATVPNVAAVPEFGEGFVFA